MPRAGLSPAAVVAEAAAILDEPDAPPLTLAAVAQRVGVALPSLYKHVGGIDDLHDRLAVVSARDLGTDLRRAVSGRSRAEAVSAAAHAYRAYALRHPGSYGYLLRPRADDPAYAEAAREVVDVLVDVLAGYGIAGEDAVVDAVRHLRSTLHGFVSLEIAGGFAMARTPEASFESLVRALDLAFTGWAD